MQLWKMFHSEGSEVTSGHVALGQAGAFLLLRQLSSAAYSLSSLWFLDPPTLNPDTSPCRTRKQQGNPVPCRRGETDPYARCACACAPRKRVPTRRGPSLSALRTQWASEQKEPWGTSCSREGVSVKTHTEQSGETPGLSVSLRWSENSSSSAKKRCRNLTNRRAVPQL